jgi:hypothetical protein
MLVPTAMFLAFVGALDVFLVEILVFDLAPQLLASF